MSQGIGSAFESIGSEELPVPLLSADVSGFAGAAGAVRIQVATVESRIESITVSGHGRTVILKDKDLTALKGFRFSRVQLAHEAGYPQLGGHSVYFRLLHRSHFEGDPFKGDPLLEETVTIALQQSGAPKVSRTRTKVSTTTND